MVRRALNFSFISLLCFRFFCTGTWLCVCGVWFYGPCVRNKTDEGQRRIHKCRKGGLQCINTVIIFMANVHNELYAFCFSLFPWCAAVFGTWIV